ncbi:MAG: TlpA family protein disulfide reductase [Clostridia bacterium]|nr:TlpA family protein disulfide reductase [Clostridia bacterium]
MKKITIPTTRALSFVLAMLMLLGVCLTACNGGSEDTGTSDSSGGTTSSPDVTTGTPDSTPGDETTTGGNENTVPYSVEIVSEGGYKFSGVTILIYDNAELKAPFYGLADTNEEGVAKFDLPSDITTYYAVISKGVPAGYEVADSYPLTGSETKITLTSSVISDTSVAGIKYKAGDIMHDFSVKTTDGETFTLSEALKTHKAVLINFWYINCSWCQEEFPYMNSVYQQYSDDIAIIALNPYESDTENAINTYKSANGLAFPMAKIDTALVGAFGIEAYPTSVMVDRYGMISVIEVGAIVSEAPFIAAFEHFKSDNYTQRIEESLQAFVEVPKPDTDMPASSEIEAAINGANGSGITYRAETGADYVDTIWDFTLVEKNGVKCLVNTNQEAHGTSALVYVDVELKAGQAVKFDYFASCEKGSDVLHVIIDNVQIYQISGESSDWQTCFPYVALKDGKYTIAIAYIKDTTDTVGEDSVYIKNFEVCDAKDINVASFIPRNCATDRVADGYGYANYVDIVFNEKDGYYHVGSANGPLLLANLMGYNTPFSEASVFDLAYGGLVNIDGVDYYDKIVQYFNYASNSAINGVCTVDKGLAELLKKVAFACGLEVENDKQWLQMCCYYDVYGGATQLADPIQGLAAHSAFIAEMGKDNVVTYDRPIMPRGLLYKFVPEKSGAYRITSNSEYLVDAWVFVFNPDRTEYYVYEGGERMYTDPNNCSMVVYFEAGKDYYIDIAFYDIYQNGSFTFKIEYIAEKYDHFTLASPGFFTFLESTDGVLTGETIAGGIDVILGDDGYYHELRADGTVGSIVYADFTNFTPVFTSSTIIDMINLNGFNYKYTEEDLYIMFLMLLHGDKLKDHLKSEWGESYEEQYENYKVDDVLAGIYHGGGEDYSEIIKEYAKLAVDNPENPERSGCVPVDEKLAEILQALMDKYTFKDVDHSWTKVCYYYRYVGAPLNP